ncbi:MAG: hypothetical protein DRI44_04645 [Chlamydiae bacterium]|nr:MAG: hypothetical protein DRI44_04645 [Chlamydiota bacterium]
MVAPNNEEWQWESGFQPQKEGVLYGDAKQITFRAEDDIQKYDVVALYGSGTTWDLSKAQLTSELPSVVSVGSAFSDGLKTIGVAIVRASSGNAVTVKLDGVVCCKTNKAVSAGNTMRGSLGKKGEKYGCAYPRTDNTGEPVLGIALNSTDAPSTAGTGTTTSPFNYRPVFVLLKQSFIPL